MSELTSLPSTSFHAPQPSLRPTNRSSLTSTMPLASSNPLTSLQERAASPERKKKRKKKKSASVSKKKDKKKPETPADIASSFSEPIADDFLNDVDDFEFDMDEDPFLEEEAELRGMRQALGDVGSKVAPLASSAGYGQQGAGAARAGAPSVAPIASNRKNSHASRFSDNDSLKEDSFIQDDFSINTSLASPASAARKPDIVPQFSNALQQQTRPNTAAVSRPPISPQRNKPPVYNAPQNNTNTTTPATTLFPPIQNHSSAASQELISHMDKQITQLTDMVRTLSQKQSILPDAAPDKRLEQLLTEKQELLTQVQKLSSELDDERKEKLRFLSERKDLEGSVRKEIEVKFQQDIQTLTAENSRLKAELQSIKELQEKQLERYGAETNRLHAKSQSEREADLESQRHKHEQEIKHLKSLHNMEKEALERAHHQSLKKQEEIFKSEFSKNSKFVDIENELHDLMKQMRVNTERVETTFEKVTEEKYSMLKSKEDELNERERYLQTMEQGMITQRDQLEKERTRLQTLFMTLESNTSKMFAQYEEERQRSQTEYRALQKKKEQLDKEYQSKMDSLLTEREELDRERSKFLSEKEEHLKQWNEERKQQSRIKSELLTFRETTLRDQASAMQEISQRELDVNTIRTKIEQEYELMKERKAIIEKERQKMIEEKHSLNKEKEQFREQTERLTKVALEVKNDSDAVAQKHQAVLQERVAAERIRSESIQIREEAENVKQRFEAKERSLQIKRKAIETDRVEIDQIKKKIKDQEKEVNAKMDHIRQLEIKLNEQLMLARASGTGMGSGPTIGIRDAADDFVETSSNEAAEDNRLFVNVLHRNFPSPSPHSSSLKEELQFWETEAFDTRETLKEQQQFLQALSSQPLPVIRDEYLGGHSTADFVEDDTFTPLRSFDTTSMATHGAAM